MDQFKFGLREQVRIIVSGEEGSITSRAEYANGAENGYNVHYKAADGRAVCGWYDESQIEAVNGAEETHPEKE